MTKTELIEKIEFAWNNPNCIWEFNRKNGYVWKEDGVTYAIPGVAVMCSGISDISLYRDIRAISTGYEWSYLCHMEQAIDFLFCGNLHGYNDCCHRAGEKGLMVRKPYFFRFKDIETIKQVLK